MSLRSHDEGQISILTLGFFALLLMVCAVVLGAAALSLLSLARWGNKAGNAQRKR